MCSRTFSFWLHNNESIINQPLMNNEILNDDIIDDVQTQECKLNVSMKNNSKTIANQQKLNNKYVMKYKKDIEDIPKHVCYCYQRLYFAHQKFYALHSYIEQFPNPLKNVISNDCVLMCKSYCKKIDFKKPLDLMLCDYIVDKKPNMEFALMLDKIKEHLFAPHFVFAQNFQL
jgi:hypothetical protein